MKTAILIYETAQVEVLKQRLSSFTEKELQCNTVIALGADVEFALEKKSVPFLSGRGFRKTPPVDRLTFAQEFSWKLFTSEEFLFFSHKGIVLGKIHAVALQTYMSIFLYYLDIVGEIVQSSNNFERIVVLQSETAVPSTSALLAGMEVNAVVDAARVVCEHHAVEMRVSHGRKIVISTSKTAFVLKRMMFGYSLSILNFVQLIRPRKKIRLLITDYWKNIEPYLNKLPEAEVILMDRSEAMKAGWRNIWKYRMRFMHSNRFSSHYARKIAKAHTTIFIDEWKSKKNVALIHNAAFRGYSLKSTIVAAVNRIITVGGEGTVLDIENTNTMMKLLKPDAVMVRASVSLQRHFAILCYVARSRGIPSIEVQHGLLYLGPGSYANHPAAEYVADYGPLARKGLKAIGYTDDKLFDIGSPRFDVYTQKQEDVAKGGETDSGNILCIVPAVSTGLWVDTYEIIDFCQSIATSVEGLSGIIVIMKLRHGSLHRTFYEKVFKQVFGCVSYRIAQKEPLHKLFVQVEVIISCYSTALLEALLVQKPVIYSGVLSMHKSLGVEIREYENKDALLIAQSAKELKESVYSVMSSRKLQKKLGAGACSFMEKQYSFRGNASTYIVEAIRSIIKIK